MGRCGRSGLKGATRGKWKFGLRLAGKSNDWIGICYRPNKERVSDPVERDGKITFQHLATAGHEPLDETPQVFLEHMTYLIPNESEREVLLDWLADLLQHPERKPMWAPLLLGPKRTGKSWIVELFKMILGAHNCGEPPKKRIVSEFNSWIAEKLFIAIHELKRKVNAHDSLAEALQEPITQSTSIKPQGYRGGHHREYGAVFHYQQRGRRR